MDPNLLDLISTLVGAGAGTYFGLKASLNGIKETTKQTLREVQEHRRDSVRFVADIRRDIDRSAE
jgi:hypothetical protein